MSTNEEASHLVDPELIPALATLPPLQFSAETLMGVRAAMTAIAAANPLSTVAAAQVEHAQCLAPDGHVLPLRIHRPIGPSGQRRAALLHVHSGGS